MERSYRAASPLYSHNPPPAYPPQALRRRWAGNVWLRVTVTPEGTVAAVRLERSSGYGILDRTALDAVRNWRFEPARRGEEAVTGEVRVPIRFRLEEK